MKTFHPYIIITLLLIISAGIVSCKNPVSDHEEEHPEAVGFRLVMGNFVVVDDLPGEVMINEFPELESGIESSEVEVLFYDFDGNLFQPDEPEQSLNIVVSDDQVLNVNPTQKWSFTLQPLSAGSANFKIELMHDSHPDFTSDTVSVIVKSSGN